MTYGDVFLNLLRRDEVAPYTLPRPVLKLLNRDHF